MTNGEPRFLLAAGGTGGHLWPALSLARAIKILRPGAECLFVGAGRPVEARIIDLSGFRRVVLKAGGWKGRGLWGRLSALKLCAAGFFEALRLIRAYRPSLCFGAGGYVTVPVGLAALVTRTPLAVHEQNSRAGLSNKFLGRFADRVMLGFGEAAAAFPPGRTEIVGNPVRPEVAALMRLERDFEREPLTVLVTGGSQGARGLNLLAAPALAELSRRPLKIIHQTGENDLEEVRSIYANAGAEAETADFFQDMAAVYARSDLAISRAGAVTLTELAAARLPAILIPLPTAADDHQTANARPRAAAGAALLRSQSELTPSRLAADLAELLDEPARLAAMSRAAGEVFIGEADRRMAEICLELAASRPEVQPQAAAR